MIFLTLEKILVEDVYDSYYESYFLKGQIDENADEGVVYMVSMIPLVQVRPERFWAEGPKSVG